MTTQSRRVLILKRNICQVTIVSSVLYITYYGTPPTGRRRKFWKMGSKNGDPGARFRRYTIYNCEKNHDTRAGAVAQRAGLAIELYIPPRTPCRTEGGSR